MTAITRLLTFVALLLMPFGMAAAPADPQATHHTASMAVGHCDGEPLTAGPSSGVADCTMPCSAALPPADPSPPMLGPVVQIAQPSVHRRLSDVSLEIATPPPKRS